MPLYEAVGGWLERHAGWPDDAAVGLFSPGEGRRYNLFPVVSAGAVGRLGYLFHPVCMFRSLAERWLIDTAGLAGGLSLIPGVEIVSSGVVEEPRTEEYNECRLVYERHLPGIRRIDAGKLVG